MYDFFEFIFLIPGILVAIIGMILLPILLHFIKKNRGIASIFFLFLNILGYILAVFYLSWGYNYNRVPFIEQSGITLIQPDSSMLMNEYILTIEMVNSLSSREDKDRLDFKPCLSILQDEMKSTLTEFNYPTDFSVRIRKWKLKGLLLRMGTSGIYIPHALEGNVDGGLHMLQLPIVASHELTHGFGITHEGVANFLAYKACSNSSNNYIKYTAELNYLRYLSSEVKRRYPTTWEYNYAKLNDKVKNDISDIRTQMLKFPDIMPKTRDKIYDQYLKRHGLKEGIQSYNLLVRLVLSDKHVKQK